jgi:hypothetical protein
MSEDVLPELNTLLSKHGLKAVNIEEASDGFIDDIPF